MSDYRSAFLVALVCLVLSNQYEHIGVLRVAWAVMALCYAVLALMALTSDERKGSRP